MDWKNPLWECHFYENYNHDSSAIVMRFHHSFTDSVGIVSIMSSLLDNEFEITMKKKFYNIPIYKKILYTIIGIPFALCLKNYPVIKSLLLYGDRREELTTDPVASKMNELTKSGSYKNKIYMSKEILFSSVIKSYKRRSKATFNDYFLGSLSISFRQWFDEAGLEKAHKIKAVIPVNLRPLPTKPSETLVGNYSIATQMELPIISGLDNAMKVSNKNFWRFFSQKFCDILS